jgi:hypothetical protein
MFGSCLRDWSVDISVLRAFWEVVILIGAFLTVALLALGVGFAACFSSFFKVSGFSCFAAGVAGFAELVATDAVEGLVSTFASLSALASIFASAFFGVVGTGSGSGLFSNTCLGSSFADVSVSTLLLVVGMTISVLFDDSFGVTKSLPLGLFNKLVSFDLISVEIFESDGFADDLVANCW